MSRKRFAFALVTVFVLTGGIVYFYYDPGESVWFPKCPFLLATGLKCPGCGSQRAIHDMLHFDFHGATAHNALLIPSVLYILLLLSGYAVRYAYPRSPFPFLIQHPVAIRSYLVLVLVFWVSRNVFGF
ncbi:MAG: DUF2752 domain-containing protein [Tannerella sp.]|jgi:hypothetical protein|nr:DUF2752 domain-containing protein [Tannerella sp.]